MHLPPPDLTTLRGAIRGLATEGAEKRAVQRCLEERALGHVWPETVHGKVDGLTVRVHLWDTRGHGGNVIALVAGPSIKGDVRLLYPHSPGQPAGQVYIPASTRRPALTDAAPRRNPADGGGRETAGTGSSLAQLQKAVSDARSEQAQVNLVARVLAGQGHAAAGKPEVHSTTVDRSTFRIYLWRDTPFGDHLILSTGPSFEPKVALASQIPAEPGVGFYVKALVDKSPRTLAGAGRAAARAMPRPTPAAEAAAEKVARKVRAPKAQVLAVAAQAAEAEGSPTVTVKHVEEAAQSATIDLTGGALERAWENVTGAPAERGVKHSTLAPSGAATASATVPWEVVDARGQKHRVLAHPDVDERMLQRTYGEHASVRRFGRTSPAVDEQAAMREAADFIRALKAMRGVA